MAAEAALEGGAHVEIYDAMPSVGRKFLLAGKGGLNLTHSEPRDAFLARYGTRRPQLAPLLEAFGPAALRAWAQRLGLETFTGSSGRVFPAGMKAAPLLRAWLHRLRGAGARIHVRHRWAGWNAEGALRFATPRGEIAARADAVVLALGGGSWPQLGSDGSWIPLIEQRGIAVSPLRPSNCGFDAGWSEHFRGRYAGVPVKAAAASLAGRTLPGEFVITQSGVEGGLIYAFSAMLRDEIAAQGSAVLSLDLAPGRDEARLAKELSHPRGRRSLSSHVRSRTGIDGVKMGLLRERVPPADFDDSARIAAAIKALPLKLLSARPLAEAISSAGGVAFESLDERLMARSAPGVFCAGEMLDWEAPTGGYLLTACFASGRAAGLGALRWLQGAGSRKPA